MRLLLSALMLLVFSGMAVPASFAESDCPELEKKPVKVEGWISKKFKKERKRIFKEFKEMGHTRTALRIFPMGDTAKVVAIGRCVPAYIARHILEKTLLYTAGVGSLVNQAFLPPHWVGIGTTMFDEPSQQKVNGEQVKQLMDPSLSDHNFHALYQKFSIQDDMVPYFGLQRPNAKKVD